MGTKRSDLSSAERRVRLLKKLRGSGGLSLQALASAFDTTPRTIQRDIAAIREEGTRVREEYRGAEKVHWIEWGSGDHALNVTYAELVSVRVALEMFARKFKGTGYDANIASALEKITAAMRHDDPKRGKDFDRKYFDINEAPRRYESTADVIDALQSGLELGQQVRCKHARVGGGAVAFDFDPYTQVTYKNGLYFTGKVHHSKTIESLPLEGFLEAEWRRSAPFARPSDDEYHPSRFFAGRWGIRGGERTDVALAFSQKVHEYIVRRAWHPTQATAPIARDWHAMRMTMNGTLELFSWILSFGKQMVVVEPATLRDEIIAELRALLALYERHRDFADFGDDEPKP